MNTIKITNPNKPLMVAHRGVSGLEQENTNAAFVAAGNRSYYGVETDVHRTIDGKFIIIHDDHTGRVAIDNLHVEESTYDTLRGLLLLQKNGVKGRTDIRMPNLEEYISICKYYEKDAVLEIKNHMEREDIWSICDIVEKCGYLEHTIFISFDFENLVFLREKLPTQVVQFLTCDTTDEVIEKLVDHKMDLDIYFKALTKEFVEKCHANGIKVNCWTVDTLEDADRMISYGVDFITSNILE